MKFDIVTIFPKIFESYLDESILKRAAEKKLVEIKIHNLRDYTTDKHKTVDDKPFGGGPGMILKVEPIYKCLKSIASLDKQKRKKSLEKIIMLDPAGKTFNQKMAQDFSKLERVILLCGRYEGFDHRVTKLADQRVSIGDYVLSGGELPALVIIEAVTRLIPGVLGHFEETLAEESFTLGKDYVEYPQYTRPEMFNPGSKVKWAVPKILLSGNHQKIKEWRIKQIRRKV